MPLACVQSEYSLVQRRTEDTLLPMCAEKGIGFLAYSPLAGGLLAGKPKEDTNRRTMVAIEQALVPIAQSHQTSEAAVVLAWLIRRTGVTAVVTGVSDPNQLNQQMSSLELNLSDEEIAQLSIAFTGAQLEQTGLAKQARRALGRILRSFGLDTDRLRGRNW